VRFTDVSVEKDESGEFFFRKDYPRFWPQGTGGRGGGPMASIFGTDRLYMYIVYT
jgi:hypothetical protein